MNAPILKFSRETPQQAADRLLTEARDKRAAFAAELRAVAQAALAHADAVDRYGVHNWRTEMLELAHLRAAYAVFECDELCERFQELADKLEGPSDEHIHETQRTYFAATRGVRS